MAYIEHDLYIALGKLLRDSREQSKFTLTDVASFMNVTPMTIQRYEKGDRKINTDTIRRLCAFYNVDSDSLMQSAVDSIRFSAKPLQSNSVSLSNEETMNTGELIKYHRINLGLSAEALAEAIGVSPSTIYRYENNDIAHMGIDKLKKIADVLGTEASSLLGWTTFKSESQPGTKLVLSQFESELLTQYRSLSSEGQEKLVEYARDLVASGRYKTR